MLIHGQTQSGGIPATRTSKIFLLQVAALATLLLMVTTRAEASYIDLTTPGSTGTIDPGTGGAAQFIQGPLGAGTGIFPAFVQIQANGTEAAYNTTVNNTLNNGSSGQHNHEVFFSDLTTTTYLGVQYYAFFLDINESNNSRDTWLTLDDLRVITSNTPNQSGALPTGTTRWSMDTPAGTDNGVKLLYDLEAGSGFADMTFLVPVADFAGAEQFVYLYSQFGLLGVEGSGQTAKDWGSSDGFEEWSFDTSGGVHSVPEPSTFALYGLGASMLFVGGLWQKRRKASQS